ncbi:hypothetical protein LJR045_002929 [Microbacterium sp. LjRoot45]|uniref:hypothetical protein n=1 Tax=Microbacterium sp. LjRoot45 TaxID=3342329 RepID=UPI003ED064DF
MGNPARELADYLDDVKQVTARQSMRDLRGVSAQHDQVVGWANQIDYASRLARVSEFLDAFERSGKDVLHYRRAFPKWAEGVFAPDVDWAGGAQTAKVIINSASIDLLRAFADLIDTSGIAVSMSPARTDSSLSALDEIVEMLESDDIPLSFVERRYVFELISSCRRVIQESAIFGEADLIARVHELIGVMTMLAETLSKAADTRTAGRKLLAAAKRVAPYVSFGGRVAEGAIGTTANILSITGGGG